MASSDAMEPDAKAARATLIGFLAVLLWALLAALTALSTRLPPLQVNAMAFAVAALIGALYAWRTGGTRGLAGAWRQPVAAWAVGVGGLFGYHALYFAALRAAPAVEASLIAYLWPLLIVLGSALLPGERLRAGHVVGALVALAGAAMIVLGGRGLAVLDLRPEFVGGYALALLCALTWSSYSLLSRRLADVPTVAVGAFCAVVALLSLGMHLALEETVVPDATEWLAVLGLGLGPVGGAFFLWDWGCKRGDIRLLGTASYAAPVLSTLVLIALGLAPLTGGVVVACLLVTLGAVIAGRASRA